MAQGSWLTANGQGAQAGPGGRGRQAQAQTWGRAPEPRGWAGPPLAKSHELWIFSHAPWTITEKCQELNE